MASAREDAPIITGQLGAFPLSDVLQFLAASRVTGTLSLTFRERCAVVVLDNGWIVDAAPVRAKNRPRLVDQDAEAELLARTCEVISRAMAWPEGLFSFCAGASREESDKPRLRPERVLMETVLSLDEERRVG